MLNFRDAILTSPYFIHVNVEETQVHVHVYGYS